MKPKIRSSQHEYDMADWLIEKASSLLTEMTLLYESLGRSGNLSQEMVKEAEDRFSKMFSNTTKILAFASGGDWADGDGKLIVKEGSAGLEQVLVKYGLLDETSEDKRKKEIKSFLDNLKPLAFEPMQVVRDKTREILSTTNCGQEEINQIIDMLGSVSKGTMSWQEFTEKATAIFEKVADQP